MRIEGNSSRVLGASWWLFCMVVAAIYSGNLVAFMAVGKENFPISSLHDLPRQTQYSWGIERNSPLSAYLMGSNISIYKELWQGIQQFNKTDPDVLSDDGSVHMRKVLSEDYVFITDDLAARAWWPVYYNLGMIRDDLTTTAFAPAFQNNSALGAFFSDKITVLGESGLVEEWERRWKWQRQVERQDCPQGSSSPQSRPASLSHLHSALYLLLVGTATSLAVLIWEATLVRCSSCRKKG